ncbi:hypothetical protein ACXX9E_29430 [Pseudomonas sp. GNP014]
MSIIAHQEVDLKEISKNARIAVKTIRDDIRICVHSMVEKPKPED